MVDSSELAALEAGLALGPDDVGAYEPRSGYADPVATTRSLAAAAVRGGAQVSQHTAVRRLLTDGDRISGVETNAGRIQAGSVILANGAWSAPLLTPVGIDLPIESVGAQVAFVSRPSTLRGVAGHLTMIDRRTGIYARPHGRAQTLVGVSQSARGITSPDSAEVLESFPADALRHLIMSMPGFVGEKVIRAHAGPLDVTPDRCALIGRVEGHEGLLLAVGMSGSGFKKSPAIGRPPSTASALIGSSRTTRSSATTTPSGTTPVAPDQP